MKIIKRSGTEVTFDIAKIMAAVSKANKEVVHSERLSDEQIKKISVNVEEICQEMNRSLSVEEIQDLVENQIMNLRAFAVARKYITYRYKRALVRKSNSTDEQILSLLECNNEEVKQENSNKNPTVNSVQRDYMAGEVSKDITKRLLLPQDIVDAHEQGLIHFHDADYFAQHMHNCCLVNLEDMLQNGTVISETMIEKPHSFSTACNIATQAIAQIASSQYGGQSISLAHLAPFVQVSREKFIKQVREEFDKVGLAYTEEKVREVAELRVRDEIKRGVQMIQYQVITLMTTNGQAPFVTVFMYLDEVLHMNNRECLVLLRGQNVLKLYKITPEEFPAFCRLKDVRVSSHTPRWRITEESERRHAPQPAQKPAPAADATPPQPPQAPPSPSATPSPPEVGIEREARREKRRPASEPQYSYGLMDSSLCGLEGDAEEDAGELAETAPYGALELMETMPEDIGGPPL